MTKGFVSEPEWIDGANIIRQRRVFVLRWNPAISGYTDEMFDTDLSTYKKDCRIEMNWSVWDWDKVVHKDIFVMMRVGGDANGIVMAGYLDGPPYTIDYDNGKQSQRHFFDLDCLFLQKPEKTGLLTASRLNEAVPEVDWEHGHSGELLSVENGEKLVLFFGNELLHAEENEDLVFDSFECKQYVIGDLVGFLSPELKRKLRKNGRTTPDCFLKSGRSKQINDLSVKYDEADITPGCKLEDILYLVERGMIRQ